MANVWLTRDQCRHDDIPAICAKCGTRTERLVLRRFTWCPWWFVLFLIMGLPGIVIAYLVMRRRMWARVPLCDGHANEWRTRRLFAWVSLLSCVGLMLAGMVVEDEIGHKIGALISMCGVIGFVVCLIAVGVWGTLLIRPREITNDDMLLTGVDPAFVDAVNSRATRGYSEYDDEARPARRRTRYEDDSDDRRN